MSSYHPYLEPNQPFVANSLTDSTRISWVLRIWQPETQLSHYGESRWRNKCCSGFSNWHTSFLPVISITTRPRLPAKPFPAPAKPHLLSQHWHFPPSHTMLVDEVCDAVQTHRGSETWAARVQWAPSSAMDDQNIYPSKWYFRSSSSGSAFWITLSSARHLNFTTPKPNLSLM